MSELILDDWQKEILSHKGHLVLCTGRQVGKTLIFSRKCAEYMLDHPKSQIIVVSLTEDQAQLMIAMILDYLDKNHKKMIAKGKRKPTKSSVSLINGARTIARPVGNTGDAVRGFTGNVLVIDEASRMPNDMWAASKPTLLTTSGEIWMCSTPHGKEGYFYECFENKNKRFAVFHKSSEEVINNRPISESWTEQRKKDAIEFLKMEKADMSALEYGQEYLGLFIEDLKQLFPDELIRRCQTARRGATISRGNDYYVGIDLARWGGDEITFEIFEKRDDYLTQIDSIVQMRRLLTQTTDDIIALDGIYNFKRIYIDDEGIGIGVFDGLITTEQTRRKTIALRNSKKIIDWNASRKTDNSGRKKMLKEDLYLNLLALMERNKIQLLDDANIFLSLKSIQYEIETDRTGRTYTRIFGNYSHIAEGIIRAAWASKEKHIKELLYSFKI